jgi:hypothetical protein
MQLWDSSGKTASGGCSACSATDLFIYIYFMGVQINLVFALMTNKITYEARG